MLVLLSLLCCLFVKSNSVCVRVCMCLFSQCVNKINPRQGFNNYRGTGLRRRGGLDFILGFSFFFFSFGKKGFGNAELDPSIIGVGF